MVSEVVLVEFEDRRVVIVIITTKDTTYPYLRVTMQLENMSERECAKIRYRKRHM